MDAIYEACRKKEEEDKQNFLKKKNSEKFEFIYNEVQEINEAIQDLEIKECDYSCDCDDNKERIEKLEQLNIMERLDIIEDTLYELGERLMEIEKMLRIDEMIKMKKKIDRLEAEERTRKYFEAKK